jgi:hypothetical protein
LKLTVAEISLKCVIWTNLRAVAFTTMGTLLFGVHVAVLCYNLLLAKYSFLVISFRRKFWQIFLELSNSVYKFLDFTTVNFLQNKVVSLASNSQRSEPSLCVYVLRWQGRPVITAVTGFPFRLFLRLAVLRWR